MSSDDVEKWQVAMQIDLDSHVENKTWDFLSLPPKNSFKKSNWFFAIRRKSPVSFEPNKARYVAKEFGQNFSQNYTATFSLTMGNDSCFLIFYHCAKILSQPGPKIRKMILKQIC